MAHDATDRFPALGWLKQQLAPESGRLSFSIKIAAICAATALAAAIYRTPEPALAAYVVFFMNARDRATSLLLAPRGDIL